MFVAGRDDSDTLWTLYQVNDYYDTEVFGYFEVTPGWTRPDIEFGPDGAMYIMEYDPAEAVVIFSKISPTPWKRMVNNVNTAIAQDVAAIEQIELALESKQEALLDAEELLENIDNEPSVSKSDVLASIAQLKNAIHREKNAIKKLTDSIENMENILELLNVSIK